MSLTSARMSRLGDKHEAEELALKAELEAVHKEGVRANKSHIKKIKK